MVADISSDFSDLGFDAPSSVGIAHFLRTAKASGPGPDGLLHRFFAGFAAVYTCWSTSTYCCRFFLNSVSLEGSKGEREDRPPQGYHGAIRQVGLDHPAQAPLSQSSVSAPFRFEKTLIETIIFDRCSYPLL